MAERRMFAKTIIDSDAFLDMPLSAQALYFHLSMRADDDGFINNPKKIQRMVGGGEDDLKLLIVKRFIIPFESGIVVIKHWKIHNYIRSDRYKETVYQEEKARLNLKENGAYSTKPIDPPEAPCLPVGIPCVTQMDTQDRLGEDRLGKGSKGEFTPEADKPLPRSRFIKPTLEEIKAYCEERKNRVDPERFFDYYESKGWVVGKSKMKDWKAAVRNWERSDSTGGKPNGGFGKPTNDTGQSERVGNYI